MCRLSVFFNCLEVFCLTHKIVAMHVRRTIGTMHVGLNEFVPNNMWTCDQSSIHTKVLVPSCPEKSLLMFMSQNNKMVTVKCSLHSFN